MNAPPAATMGDAHRLAAAGRLDDAVAAYRAALATPARAGDAQGWLALALCLRALGLHADALAPLERALELRPDDASIALNLADCLATSGQSARAHTAYQGMLDNPTAPADLRAQAACGLAQLALDHDDPALARGCALQATTLAPDLPLAWHLLGVARVELGDGAGAEAALRRALSMQPAGPDADAARIPLALARKRQGDLAGAAALLRDVLTRRPDDADARFNLARVALEAGDLAQGWPAYEARWAASAFPSVRRAFALPVWRGESLWGRGLLLWGEQGLGDEILFAGVLPDLLANLDAAAIAAGTRVMVECDARLVPLLARALPQAAIFPRQDPPHPALAAAMARGVLHYQMPLGSLARYCRPTLAHFANARPWLRPDPTLAAHWRQRLAALDGPAAPAPPTLKVGVCWTSGLLTAARGLYPTPQDLLALAAVPGVRLINLQYNSREPAVAAALAASGLPLADWPDLDQRDDLDAVAALIANLDLVITAPTSVGELAASLGVPVWRLSGPGDWSRLGTNARPWYPAMRTVPTPNGPGPALAALATDLRRLALT